MAMKSFVIERTLPGAGDLSPIDLQHVSQRSCSVLKGIGPSIEWMHSYVGDDKIYCVYRAESEELVWEHARQGGFPIDRVSEIRSTIGPEAAG